MVPSVWGQLHDGAATSLLLGSIGILALVNLGNRLVSLVARDELTPSTVSSVTATILATLWFHPYGDRYATGFLPHHDGAATSLLLGSIGILALVNLGNRLVSLVARDEVNSLISYCNNTRDFMVPSVWGQVCDRVFASSRATRIK
jgi:hypothetical protein